MSPLGRPNAKQSRKFEKVLRNQPADIFSITFLSTGNAFAGDMASVSVTIRFWSPSRAKAPADSLDCVLSNSAEKEPGETAAKKPDRKRDTSFTALATTYPVSEESDYFSNAAGGGGERKECEKMLARKVPLKV